MKKDKIVQAGYDKVAKKYHARRNTYPSKALLHKFSNSLQNGAHVLDLGCGAGVPVDQYLSNNGFQVTGIDFSKKMIELAKKHVPKAIFKKMDICRIQLKENSFDGMGRIRKRLSWKPDVLEPLFPW